MTRRTDIATWPWGAIELRVHIFVLPKFAGDYRRRSYVTVDLYPQHGFKIEALKPAGEAHQLGQS